MSRHNNHLFFIILFVISSLILSKKLFKIKNENTLSDKISKSKTLQINQNCGFEYFDENNYSSSNFPSGTLVATCSKLEYPIKLGKLVSFENRKLQTNSVGQGFLVEKCKKCNVYRSLGYDNKYNFILFCRRCIDDATGDKFLSSELDLRPILTNYFDY